MSKVSRTASFLCSLFSKSDRKRSGRKLQSGVGSSIFKSCLLLTAIVGLSLAGQTALAATFTWDPDQLGPLTTGGSGNWDLTDTFWYSGATDSSWGSTSGTDTAYFGGMAGTVTLSGSQSAGGLIFGSNNYTITGSTLNLAGAAPTIQVGLGNLAVISSLLAGSGGLLVNGGGTLSLQPGNPIEAYTGNTAITNGTDVQLAGGGSSTLPATTILTLGESSTNTTGIIDLQGGTQTLAGLYTAGTGGTANTVIDTLGTAAQPGLLTLNLSSGTDTFGGTLGLPGANQFKLKLTGSGVLTLTSSNAYAGGTVVSSGTASLSNSSALGSGAITLGSTGATSAAVLLNTAGVTLGQNITVSNSATQAILGGSNTTGTTTFNSLIADGSGVNLILAAGNGGTTLFNGAISSAGSVTVNSPGGTIALNANNTYGGTTTITAGTVLLGSNSALSTTAVSLGNNGANNTAILLNASGITVAPASITVSSSGAGVATIGSTLTSGSAAITAPIAVNLGTNLALTSASGGTAVLTSLAGSGGVTMNGPGLVVLSGTGINYSGNTTITSGTLETYDARNFSWGPTSPANTINIASGAMLQMYVDNSSGNAGDYANQGIGTGTGVGTTITGSGTFQLQGGGVLASSLNNNGKLVMQMGVGGLIDIENGNFRNGGWSATTWTNNQASMYIASAGTMDLWDGTTVIVNALNGPGLVSKFQGTGGGTLEVGVAGGSGTFSGSIQSPQSGTPFGNSTAGSTVSLTKVGAGIEVLSGSNSYGGTTTISAGTLQIGNFGNTGTLGTGGGVTDTSVLAFARSDTALIVANLISGAGTVAQVGTGMTTLTAANTYTGPTIISTGTLQFGGAGGTLSGPVYDNSILALASSANQVLSGVISGNGTLLQLGGGITTLTGANIYTGPTIISGGTIAVSNTAGSGTGTSPVSLNGGYLAGSGTISTTVSAGAAAANQVAPGGLATVGTLTLGGLQTTGSTTLNISMGSAGLGGSSLLNISGPTLSLAPNTLVYANPIAPLLAGNYPFLKYAVGTTSLASTGNLTLSDPLPRQLALMSIAPDATPGLIDLIVSSAGPAISGSWLTSSTAAQSWTSAGNWQNGTIPATQGDIAVLGTAASTAVTIGLNSSPQIGTLTFNPSGSGAYTIAAGSPGSILTLYNTGSTAYVNSQANYNVIASAIALGNATNNFNVSAGSLMVSGPITGGTNNAIVKSGTGLFELTNAANAFTGGINVTAGTLGFITTSLGQGPITLSGAVLSQNALAVNGTTGTQVSLPAGNAINVTAPSGIDIQGNGWSGKILFGGNNSLTGTGGLTKTGNGDLQTTGVYNPNYTGNWIINAGQIEAQGVQALGWGSVTINNGGELDIANLTYATNNPITLSSGGTLGGDSANATAVASGSVTVPSGTATISVREDWSPGNGASIALGGALSGSGAINLVGSTTASSIGVLTIGGPTTSYSGNVTVNNNVVLGLASGPFGTGSNTITFSGTGSYLMLASDGPGTGQPTTISYALPASQLSGTANLAGYYVGRLGGGATYNQALNQTIQPTAALSYGSTLSLTPLNGYGLLLTNQPAMAATNYFNVAGTQASNVVQGLTLANLAGAYGIVKQGTGTLVLSTGNTFGGAGDQINITAGMVSTASDAALGNSLNVINLNTNSATQGFRGTATFSESRTFILSQAANDIDVTAPSALRQRHDPHRDHRPGRGGRRAHQERRRHAGDEQRRERLVDRRHHGQRRHRPDHRHRLGGHGHDHRGQQHRRGLPAEPVQRRHAGQQLQPEQRRRLGERSDAGRGPGERRWKQLPQRHGHPGQRGRHRRGRRQQPLPEDRGQRRQRADSGRRRHRHDRLEPDGRRHDHGPERTLEHHRRADEHRRPDRQRRHARLRRRRHERRWHAHHLLRRQYRLRRHPAKRQQPQ